MKVMVAMSGGVDSSVAAALLLEGGHQVVGATLKLWGGDSDSGCCSVADVEDARRVADQLGIPHHVFNLTDRFEEAVVGPYVTAHAEGRTPNPCIDCNRHLKFGTLLDRADRLGFEALATGHHARVLPGPSGRELRRGADRAKDQSYVLSMLTGAELPRILLPVGELTKAEVRARAARLGLRTATKPDSQDVCFIHSTGGRRRFLGDRIPLHPGDLLDARTGDHLGTVPAVELVTVGQRRGLGSPGGGPRRFAVAVDVPGRRVLVGEEAEASATRLDLDPPSWVDAPFGPGDRVLAQTSAHGPASPATLGPGGAAGTLSLDFEAPHRRVAPGQTVALYDPLDPDRLLGGGTAR